MRSLLLLMGLFAAPLAFIGPAEAQTIPPCCQPEGESSHPPDPRNRGPIYVPAEVTRRDERALTAGAEASVEEEAPVANALALPTDEPRVVAPPLREPIVAADQTAPDFDIELPPCCRAVGETEPPHPDSKETPPVLVGAEVKNRDERTLEATVELSTPVEIPLVNAIGIPLQALRGVSEPAYRPAPVEAAGSRLSTLEGRAALIVTMLLLLLATLWIRWLRRSPVPLDNQPPPQRPRPSVGLPWFDLEPVRSVEPVSASTKEREPEPV